MRRLVVVGAAIAIVVGSVSAQQRVPDSLTYSNPALYAERKAEWLARVDRLPDNVDVLEGAADFFLIPDRALARELYERVRALEPGNPRWLDKLAQLHRLNAASGDVAEARRALELSEEALQLRPPGERQLPTKLPMAAFDAGDLIKAHAYAMELLAAAGRSPRSFAHGDAVHQANVVLGRIAVIEGRIPEAIGHLQAAGNIPGSPVLNSFGPNMTLARDLLERGETDAVIQYFEQCRTFWKLGGERLDDWIAQARGGRIPNFGANLRY